MTDVDDREVLERLQALFAAHGVALRPRDGWLVGGSGTALSVSATVRSAEAGSARVLLEVDVSLPDRRLITESFAGLGESPAQALDDGIENFVRSSLHVLLTAFFEHPPDEQVTVEALELDGTPWRLVAGNFTCRSSGGDVEVPEELFDAIDASIRSSRLHHDVHWFRTFYCQIDGEPSAKEWLMDNLPWTEAVEPLSRVPWREQPGYYSIRGFMVVTREHPAKAEWLDTEAGLREGLSLAVAMLANPRVSDHDVYRVLTNARIDPDLAERLIAFVPIGFSSVLLESSSYPTTYQVADASYRPGPERPLDDEPVFRAARARALASTPEQRLAVASRCSLATCAKQMFGELAGLTRQQLDRAVFTPFAVVFPRFSPRRSTPRKLGRSLRGARPRWRPRGTTNGPR